MSRTIALITGASSGIGAPDGLVPGLEAQSTALDVSLAAALLTGALPSPWENRRWCSSR